MTLAGSDPMLRLKCYKRMGFYSQAFTGDSGLRLECQFSLNPSETVVCRPTLLHTLHTKFGPMDCGMGVDK